MVYGHNNEMDRRSLWRELVDLQFCMNGIPWIAMGDFNVIKHMNERSDFHEGMHTSMGVEDFQACLHSIGLIDLNSHGVFYTWSNKRSDGFIAKKLDRILVNDFWLLSFPSSFSEFTAPDFSDHSPGWMKFPSFTKGKSCPFRFFTFISLHRDFLSTVDSSWR